MQLLQVPCNLIVRMSSKQFVAQVALHFFLVDVRIQHAFGIKNSVRDTPGAKKWVTLPQFFRKQGYISAGMGKIFHPVKYMGKYDDIAGGSWSMPYFHGIGGEDTKHKLNATNCGVNSSIEDDSLYTDGMIAEHAIKTMRNFSKASNSAPFFIAVGFHRPHLPWVVPSRYFDMYPKESDIPLADYENHQQTTILPAPSLGAGIRKAVQGIVSLYIA